MIKWQSYFDVPFGFRKGKNENWTVIGRRVDTKNGLSFLVFGWSWCVMSVFGSQVFRQALMESCTRELNFLENVHLPRHISCVMCHMSHVTCPLSGVTRKVSQFFFTMW